MSRSVALVTLGCARNEVDSEELAGRLLAEGWQLVDDPTGADAVLINTCGFIDAAKQESIDAVIAAAEQGSRVVAVGCLAERYGRELADVLTEADAVLSFDDYPQISERLNAVLAGEHLPSHEPKDRRTLLPISPVGRRIADHHVPGHSPAATTTRTDAGPRGWRPPILRHRLDDAPIAPVKLASGCDRRCAFCAIPSFRGAFVSRPVPEVLTEITWLADQGVQEVVLVSENSTSYGKDLGNPRLLEALLAELGRMQVVPRVRIAYLQPAEMRPTLVAAIAQTPTVLPYFDLSFQHASSSLLRRMRRFGGTDDFLELLTAIRTLRPDAGVRSNVIVGFPGETEADVDELCAFLDAAALDAIGVFAYSDEEGTEAAGFTDKVDSEVVQERAHRVQALADALMTERAGQRLGERLEVLVTDQEDSEQEDTDNWPVLVGRAGHQGPQDPATLLTLPAGARIPERGALIDAVVVAVDGLDLVAELVAGQLVASQLDS
ncbi:MAG: 30S ribosomal protein S12 methylthiotransferase RimO [Actinomycetales bacterium]|nr:30S ribosomal protein S12 methylthiotransferase RimO [Actinomycetales bacterium]